MNTKKMYEDYEASKDILFVDFFNPSFNQEEQSVVDKLRQNGVKVRFLGAGDGNIVGCITCVHMYVTRHLTELFIEGILMPEFVNLLNMVGKYVVTKWKLNKTKTQEEVLKNQNMQINVKKDDFNIDIIIPCSVKKDKIKEFMDGATNLINSLSNKDDKAKYDQNDLVIEYLDETKRVKIKTMDEFAHDYGLKKIHSKK